MEVTTSDIIFGIYARSPRTVLHIYEKEVEVYYVYQKSVLTLVTLRNNE